MTKPGVSNVNVEKLAALFGHKKNKPKILCHAPPGAGKSVFASSISKFWPTDEEFPFKSRPVGSIPLSDVAYLAIDDGALDCLLGSGVYIPDENVLDFAEAMEVFKEPVQIIQLFIERLKQMNEQGACIEAVVVDTITILDNYLTQKLTGMEDMQFYKAIRGEHIRAHQILSKSGFAVVFLAHSHMPIDMTGKNTDAKIDKELKARATQATHADIVIDVTGRAKSAYVGNCSLECTIVKKSVDAKKGVFSREVVLTDMNFETKSRFEHILGQKEKPHLRAMLHKVGLMMDEEKEKSNT